MFSPSCGDEDTPFEEELPTGAYLAPTQLIGALLIPDMKKGRSPVGSNQQ